jgi:hypothetical protein
MPVDCDAARSRSEISKPKPIRRYGLRQEEDASRALTPDVPGFSGPRIEKTFVVAIG